MGLSPAEKAELKVQFEVFDADRSGQIDKAEIAEVMKSINEPVDNAKIDEYMKEVDTDKSGTIDFEEFCMFVEKMRSGKVKSDSGFGAVVTKSAQINVVQSQHATHSFSDEEKEGFVEYINDALRKDPDLAHLKMPLQSNDMTIFTVADGMLLCKLINFAVPKTIDERAINKIKGLNNFKITENQNLVIQSAKGIGCNVVNVGPEDLKAGKVHIVLGLLWQIIRIGLLSQINLKNNPNLIRLLEPGETLEDLLKLSPEQILLRWFNYHLKAAGSPRRVNNFTGDIKDSECYTILLNQLAPQKCDKKALNEKDPMKRAEMVLENAGRIECRKFLRPKDIVAGNAKLNLAFVANLFNTLPGLDPVAEPIKIEEIEETREERAFRNWMNSLGVDPYVNNLYEDLRDGIILLQLLDKIRPGIVNWKKVYTKKPLSKFQQLENCNYAILLGKDMKFSLVGIGGQDIQSGNKKLTLAIIWQAMRMYVLNFLKVISKGGKDVTDEDIINWANGKVKGAGKGSGMKDFKDKSLSNSKFIFDLLSACSPEAINFDNVIHATTDEDKIKNASYAISCARKMGCTVFLLPEDIVEVKDKLIMTFFGAVMQVYGQ